MRSTPPTKWLYWDTMKGWSTCFFCVSLAIQRVAFTIGMTGSTVNTSELIVFSKYCVFRKMSIYLQDFKSISTHCIRYGWQVRFGVVLPHHEPSGKWHVPLIASVYPFSTQFPLGWSRTSHHLYLEMRTDWICLWWSLSLLHHRRARNILQAACPLSMFFLQVWRVKSLAVNLGFSPIVSFVFVSNRLQRLKNFPSLKEVEDCLHWKQRNNQFGCPLHRLPETETTK